MESPSEHSPEHGVIGQVNPEACQFCEEVYASNFLRSKDEINTMFHEYCSTCVPPDPSLCERCQHMRLRHQLFCERRQDYEISVGMKSLTESIRDETGSDCTLCSFALQIAQQSEKSLRYIQISFEGAASANEKIYRRTGFSFDTRNLHISVRYESETRFVQLVAYDLGRNEHMISECAKRGRDSLSRPHLIKDVIDWDFLKDQLTVCCREHTDCYQQPSQLPSGFRLIDVQDRCLVRAWTGIEFLALSYVWGTNLEKREHTKGVLTKDFEEELEHKNSLRSSELPATVEDAIQACMDLGERYLWVDRLCILQDDLDSKKHQIHAMGNIFASAKLVMIAAGAEHMHEGICGISKTRKTRQISTQVSGMELVQELLDIYKCVEETVWSSRAWTYQEAVLARRNLWLTDHQTFFECSRGVFPEDNFGPVYSTEYFIGVMSQLLPSTMSSAETYYYHLSSYTLRSLTFRSDIFNGFTGIANNLYGGDSLIFGLPLNDFDEALLWGADSVARESRDMENLIIPSWTWASVRCRVYAEVQSWNFCGTLVQWSVCTESEGQLSHLPIKVRGTPSMWSEQEDDTRTKFSPQLYLAVAWAQNCIRGRLPTSLQSASSSTFAELDASAKSNWTSYSSFCDDQCPLWIDSNRVPTGVTTQLKPGVLVGRAQTTFLTAFGALG